MGNKKIHIAHIKNLCDLGESTLYKNPAIVTDSLASSSGAWAIGGTWTTSSFTYSNSSLALTGVTYPLSMVKNNACRGRNFIVSVDVSGADGAKAPQMQLRGSQNNFLIPYIEASKCELQTYLNGAVSSNLSSTIVGFSTSNTYTLVAKAFEDYFSYDLICNGATINNYELCNETIYAMNGVMNGLGAMSGTAYFKNWKFVSIKEFINVICFGDSLTYGYGLPAGAGNSYPHKLKALFADKPFGFMNKGVTGNIISQLTARLGTDIFPNKSNYAKNNIIVLMIGSNDTEQGQAPATVYSNLVALYNTLKNSGFEVWIVTPPPREDNATYKASLVSYCNLLRSSVDFPKVIDFYSKCLNTDGSTKTELFLADKVHLTASGNDLLADTIKTELFKRYSM